MLWIGPFMDETILERTTRFLEAAKRGADIRYMVSTDIFRADELSDTKYDIKSVMKFRKLLQKMKELKRQGLKFDFRIYDGPKTYFQVSFNKENMTLVITENPMTATWITRDFNPDLIDNAVKSFDREWKKGRSILEMTPEDFAAFSAEPDGLITKIFTPNDEG
jgi:hypothetical protein